jgi:hypothetical protein
MTAPPISLATRPLEPQILFDQCEVTAGMLERSGIASEGPRQSKK